MRQIDVVVLGMLSEQVADLRGELHRAKAALLYGDRIIVESYKVPFLLARIAMRTRRLARHMAETGGFDQRMAKDVAADMERRGVLGDNPNAETILKALRGEEPELLMKLPEVIAELMRQRQGDSSETKSLFHAIGTVAVVNRLRSHPSEDHDAVIAAVEELNRLAESGLVIVETGEAEVLAYTEFENMEDSFLGTVDRALDMLRDPHRRQHPLLSTSTRLSLRKLRGTGQLSGANFVAANRVELASQLIMDIPSFPDAKVDELLDVRRKVEPHLARFRAAVADLEEQLRVDVLADEFNAEVQEIKLREVDPALEELRQSLRDTGALPALARAAKTMSASTLALGVAMALGAPDLAGAVAVAAGGSTAVATELLERHSQENERKRSRLFLLFDVQRTLAGSAC